MITMLVEALYSILFLPLILVIIIVKICKNRKYLNRLNERFACFSFFSCISLADKNKNYNIDLWVHTVSVGEFIAVKPLLAEILSRDPQIKILITSTTLTSSDLIIKYIEETDKTRGDYIKHLFYPYDNRIICANFLRKTKPKKAIFFETEIWPKMFTQIKKRNIPLYIINARLSSKSYSNYRRIKFYIKSILNKVDFIAAQSEADKNRFIDLGYSPDKIAVYGNIKYNIKIPDDINLLSKKYSDILRRQNKLVLIAASTHQGEEEIVLNIYKNLKQRHSNLLLILVPRHPERFVMVSDLCINHNLITVKYTDLENLDREPSEKLVNNFDVLLLNTMGRLLYFYNICDLAFIGGSMVDVGGHNPIESAVLGVPNIMGPNYDNFVAIVEELQSAGNLMVVKDRQELVNGIDSILSDNMLRAKMARAADDVIKSNQNILNKYLSLV